jgi:uncharacterized repeat protein (TIGR02543 family)
MMYKFAFRGISLAVTAALLCVVTGCGDPPDPDLGGEVNAYLGTFNPTLEIRIVPENGGKISTSVSPRDDGTYKYGDTVLVMAEANRGYMFNGWSGILMDTVQVVMDGNKVMTANFVRIYTITFDANGGEGTPPDRQKVPAGSNITLPDENDLRKANGSFGGWEHRSAGVTYPAGATFTVKGDEILYAKWGDEYTITFNANGGSGVPPEARTIPAGSKLIVPDSGGLYNEGYAFDGWSAGSVDGHRYGAGGTYTPTRSIAMYARWVSIYAVKFNNDGGGAVPDMLVRSGTVITLPKPDGRNNYVFDGWTDNHNHGTYQAGDRYVATGNTTMSANWNPVFIITFNLNGGTGRTPTSYTAALGAIITLPWLEDANKPDYVFAGWNANSNGTGINYPVGSAYMITSSAVLYADWKPLPSSP